MDGITRPSSFDQQWIINVGGGYVLFIKSLKVYSDEIAIQQRERIELAKMCIMVQESKEFSLKDSLLSFEKGFVKRALKRHNNSQVKAAQSLGMADRTIRHIIK